MLDENIKAAQEEIIESGEAMELYFKRDFEGAHEKLVEVLPDRR